ncbi:MAG TPA: hypothetical protein VLI54_01550 [Bacillota bacterium]|nr:hypothetical protein [Bacillota bacterium]
MSYVPIGGVGTLELPPQVDAARVGIDPVYIGRLAARRGLGQFYLTHTNGWPDIPQTLSRSDYDEAEYTAGMLQATDYPFLFSQRSEPLGTEDDVFAEEMTRLERGKSLHMGGGRLAIGRVLRPSFRHSHGRPPFAVGVRSDGVALELANQIDRNPNISPTRATAAILNVALKQGLSDATWIHHLEHLPEGEQRLAGWLHTVLSTTSVVGLVEGFPGMVAGFAAGIAAHNGLRAYLAHREGARLREFCWSFLPTMHLDRVLLCVPPRKPLVKAL